MSSVITGSNGFLGSALVRRLIVHGDMNPICLVRRNSNTAKLEAIRGDYPNADFRIRHGSLATIDDARRAIIGADTVFHLAAMLNGPPADMYLNTVVTSRNLLAAATQMDRPPRILLVSSFGVYGVAFLPRLTTINEDTPLEPASQHRDLYSQVKLRQERLFWEYQKQYGFDLIVMRPGAIYGPQSLGISSRVGLQMPGVFLFLGGDNALPLSYVDNCADALILASRNSAAVGQALNVHDDELPTCREFLQQYRRQVRPLRVVTVPYLSLLAASRALERYRAASKGQLPAIFTPYKTRSSWKPMRFDNSRLRAIGWHPGVSTADGLRRTFLKSPSLLGEPKMNQANAIRQTIRTGLKHALPRRVFLIDGSDTGDRAVALTFDDGPHPEHTPQILNYLATANVKATFFFRGDHALRYPDIVRRAHDNGHDIGNHSFSHSEPKATSAFALTEELMRTSLLLEVLTGTRPSRFRPPKGDLSPLKFLAVLATRHTIVLWNRDPRDYLGDTDAAISKLFQSSLNPGDIVLLHDSSPVAIKSSRLGWSPRLVPAAWNLLHYRVGPPRDSPEEMPPCPTGSYVPASPLWQLRTDLIRSQQWRAGRQS